jgi:hypothetical protein
MHPKGRYNLLAMATKPHAPRRPSATEIGRALRERNAPRRAEVERRLARMRRYVATLNARRS